jgi:hypothetical protein
VKTELPDEVTISVPVKRELLAVILQSATRDNRSAADVIRERLEASVLWRIKAELADGRDPKKGMRPKRPNGAIHDFRERLMVRLPLPTKCEIMRLARENALTQDELGWIIVRTAIADQAWLSAALAIAKQGSEVQ